MVDLASFLTVGGMAAFLMLLFQFIKLYLPPQYKPAIPWLALALGMVLTPLFGLAVGQVHTWGDALAFVVTGLLAGLSSVGIYQSVIDPIKALRKPPALPIPPTVPHG